jgi:DNA-binding transcriptional regulator YdaS (Cro superfamily)
MSTPFVRAIEIVGSQKRMAEVCGVSQQLISVYVVEERKPQAEWVLAIEKATRDAGSEVSRHELRPDIYPSNVEHAVTTPLAEQFKPQAAE